MGQLRSDMVGLKRIENGLKTIELVEHLHTQPIIGRVKTSKLLDLGVSIRPLTRCDLQISRCLADNCHVMSCIYIYKYRSSQASSGRHGPAARGSTARAVGPGMPAPPPEVL